MTPAPYRPRHRRPWRRYSPQSASVLPHLLLAALSVACLLGAALCLGGLLAHPLS